MENLRNGALHLTVAAKSSAAGNLGVARLCDDGAMSRSLNRACLASIVLAASAAIGSPAQAAPSPNRCTTASHRSGAHIDRRNTRAVVWHRNVAGERRVYACVFRDRVVRRLRSDPSGRLKLRGTWLAYVYAGSAIGDESDKIGVVNLRTGRNRAIAHIDPSSEGQLDETDNGGSIPNFAIATNGTVAWLTTAPLRDPGVDRTQLTLRVGDGRRPAERIVDQGRIARLSLRVNAAGTRVTYTKDAIALSAPLRR